MWRHHQGPVETAALSTGLDTALSKIVSGIPGSPSGPSLRYTRSTRYDDQRPASRPRAATHICAQCYRGLRGSLKLQYFLIFVILTTPIASGHQALAIFFIRG